jgi:MoaA/NifB/PqqE/SkfB family radical SAM enzyme
MAISLDGPDAASHDGRVEGSFAQAMFGLEYARQIGLEMQIHTAVTRHNLGRIDEIVGLVRAYGARLWSVFFLVATGRASASQDLSARNTKRYFNFCTICQKQRHSTSRQPKRSTTGATWHSSERPRAPLANVFRRLRR